MDGYEVKKVMAQVHISPEMQEEVIMNIQERMEQGNKKTSAWNFRRAAVAAAAFVLAAGVVGFPVRAFVTSVVKERMESVPEAEMKGLNDMVQSQHVAADGFSRPYSDSEKERFEELWQVYENGTFPEKVIAQVDSEENVPEGTLCYIRATGVFNLPAQEMTDEEMLQIIDFQHKMSYAVAHGPQVQAAAAEAREKAARLEKIVQDANGIGKDEAVEIAKKRLMTDLGDKADELELMTDSSGSGASLLDALDYAEVEFERESKEGVIYDVSFGNPDTHAVYGYIIDAVDGSVLYTYYPENFEQKQNGRNDEQAAETGSIMRAYSDTEKERMAKLQQSYQDETAKPEKMIPEVDSAEGVTEGALCYIISTGEYYLPDRELTDEELLEIIDCNFRISLDANRKTQEEWDALTRAERAELEAKVKAAGGISEAKAVEIAQKAMEKDLGEKAKELKLCVDETFGWSSDLCVADWSEIKEEDKGALAYSIGFGNMIENETEIEDLLNYVCVVNAVDGSILEAYTIQGWDNATYYEH